MYAHALPTLQSRPQKTLHTCVRPFAIASSTTTDALTNHTVNLPCAVATWVTCAEHFFINLNLAYSTTPHVMIDHSVTPLLIETPAPIMPDIARFSYPRHPGHLHTTAA